jgi:hypothetical protein
MWRRGRKVELKDSPRLDAFFGALDRLGEVQLLSMRASWMSVGKPAHETAWSAVRAVGARFGLADEIEGVRKRAMAWSSRGHNSIPYRLNNDENWAQVKLEAEEAVVDAALAIALGDRLDEQSRAILLEPWERARTGEA